MVFEHRGRRLLDLQEQRILLVASLQQDDERARADAADTDDLASHVDHLEPLQQVAPIVLQRGPVGAQLLVDRVLQLIGRDAVGRFEFTCRDDDGRLADDPVLAVHQFAELRQRLQAVARVRLLRDLLGPLFVLLQRLLLRLVFSLEPFDRRHQICLGQMGVPDVHRRHLSEIGHRRPVGAHRGERRVAPLRLAEAVVARRDREARRHPLHVVLERTRQRLVEIVQIEQKLPLGRSEHTEIRQMRVATQLNRQARPRRVLEICGHDLRRAPVEGERRDHHPPVSHRHQIGLTSRVLLLEQADRVRTVSSRFPASMAGRVYLLTRFLSERPALLDTRMLNLASLHGLTLHFVFDLLARIGGQPRERAWPGGQFRFVRPAGLQPALAERGTSGIVSEREPDPRGGPQRSRGEGACRVDIVDNARCDLAQYSVVQPPRDEILIEKRKWDGSVAGRVEARLLTADLDTFVWVVAPGSTRVKPRQGSAEVVSDPEVWLASRACSFVVCARAAGHDSIDSVEVHAALLAEPGSDSELVWVDLDLDLLWNPTDDTVSLKDFEDLVRRWDEMLYPDQLVRKAWNAIGEALTRIHRSEWPFDGTLETYLREAHHATTNPPTRTLRSRELHIDVLHERDRAYAHTDKKGLRLPPRWAEPWRRRSPG